MKIKTAFKNFDFQIYDKGDYGKLIQFTELLLEFKGNNKIYIFLNKNNCVIDFKNQFLSLIYEIKNMNVINLIFSIGSKDLNVYYDNILCILSKLSIHFYLKDLNQIRGTFIFNNKLHLIEDMISNTTQLEKFIVEKTESV